MATPVWLEPVRGGYPDLALFAHPGIDQVRGFIQRKSPRPPISHLTGMLPVEAGPGLTTFTMPASPWLLSPPGLIQGGVLAVLADGPLGCAIQTTLPPATPYTTAELSMNFLRPASVSSGVLTARGTLIHSGRSLALSQVSIEDARGRLLAHGTSRCVIFAPMSAPDAQELHEIPPSVYDTPDPFERPDPGAVIPEAAWASMTGLEIMRALAAGELPPPPIHHLTGMMPTVSDEGKSTFRLPSTEWLCSPLGRVEGGVIAMLADSAIASSIQATLPARTSYATIDLKVTFIRPVSPDGRDLTAHATVIHRGRTLATASAEVLNADGKQVATAVGSAMIFADRTQTLGRLVEPADEPLAD
jgi:uncharacterized protein (TIGR00369 family)